MPKPTKSSSKSGGAKKAVKPAAKAPKKKAVKAAKPAKRKANPALMRPVQPDAALGAVVGNKPMPRSQITKKVWDYIKKNDLQDAKNRRNINADDMLKPIFNNKKTVTMFEMTKLVNSHISA
jgi:upstream activation factor subunit UAF30